MPSLPDAVDPRAPEMRRLYVDKRLTMQEIGDRYGLSRERVRQILKPLDLEMHYGARKQEERKTRLRKAFARVDKGKSTMATEAEILGYGSTESLRVAFSGMGLKRTRRRSSPPPHGTLARYKHHKCRCRKCRKAASDAHLAMIAQGPKKHGTSSSYRNYGCRCESCRIAERVDQRIQRSKRRRRKEPVG